MKNLTVNSRPVSSSQKSLAVGREIRSTVVSVNMQRYSTQCNIHIWKYFDENYIANKSIPQPTLSREASYYLESGHWFLSLYNDGASEQTVRTIKLIMVKMMKMMTILFRWNSLLRSQQTWHQPVPGVAQVLCKGCFIIRYSYINKKRVAIALRYWWWWWCCETFEEAPSVSKGCS